MEEVSGSAWKWGDLCLKATLTLLLWPGSAELWPGTAAVSAPQKRIFLSLRLQRPDHLTQAHQHKQLEGWGGERGITTHNCWVFRSRSQPLTHSVHRSAEVTLLQDIQQLRVRVSPTRVQILPDGPTEQEGVLGNYGQPRPAGGATTTQMTVFFFFF